MNKKYDIIQTIANTFRVGVREQILNPLLGGVRLRGLKNPNFTILSNNCWAGHVYRYFNIPYNTPTVGMYFFAEEYIRFLSSVKQYVSEDLKFINVNDSKYRDELMSRKQSILIGVLGDVEISLLHYKTEEEAYEKWNRRCKRIYWDNLYVKFSEQNLCNEAILNQFDKMDYCHKFFFTTHDYKYASQVVLYDSFGEDEVKNDTLYFRKYINLTKWLNGDEDFRIINK